MKKFKQWTHEMVREYYDHKWDLTLHELSALSGYTKAELKQILMNYRPDEYDYNEAEGDF
jgi:hypothetical protein